MTKRIIRKKMAINNPYNKKYVYVVDGVYIFQDKKNAIAWTKKYNSRGQKL